MNGGRAKPRAGAPEVDLQVFLRTVFGCSPEIASTIARKATERRYSVRAIILKQGDRANVVYLLVAGKAHALASGRDGQLVMLHEFLPGDFFGALVQAENAPEEADIVAIDALRASTFAALDFLSLSETYACVGHAVSRVLFRQMRNATLRMAERTTLSAPGRIYVELLRRARVGDGRTVSPAPVFAELAVRVSSTRETVSRTINALERRGIVRREGSVLVIVAPHRLEEMIL